MNNHRDQKEKLLAEAFHGEWNDGTMTGFALEAARHARRRTRVRRSFAVVGATAGIAAALVFALKHQTGAENHPAVSVATVQAPVAPAYEIISDEELLAQLKDQPLLVVQKKDGSREFVLLGN